MYFFKNRVYGKMTCAKVLEFNFLQMEIYFKYKYIYIKGLWKNDVRDGKGNISYQNGETFQAIK